MADMKASLHIIAALLAATTIAVPAYADGIIDNVNGITLDQDGNIIRFTALMVDDAGKVSQLVTAKQKPSKRPAWRQDGGGRTMIPGLIDSDGDVIELGFRALTLDLSRTTSLAGAKAAMAAYAAEHPNRRWILGRGWDQSGWADGAMPNAADIDAIISDRPVWLIHADGSAGWANSAALAAAGVTAKSQIGASGRIEKIAGKPSGILAGRAMDLITEKLPAPRAKDRDLALYKGQSLLLSRGITSTTDMGTDIADWQAFRRAGDTRRLNMRIFSYADSTETMELIAGPAPTPWLYDDRLRMGGVSIAIDGGLASRGAWLKSPYVNAPDERGFRRDSYAELRNAMVRGSMDGFQISLRANGDAAVSEAISAVADLSETFPGDKRWRIEGASVVDPADLPRLNQQDIAISITAPTDALTRKAATRGLGEIRMSTALAANSLLQQGALLALQANVEAGVTPFESMAAAITREDTDGQPFGGWRPLERLSREAALAGFTTAPAKAAFAETKVGILTPGQSADFVLMDTDPLLAAPSALRRAKVLETWVAGRVVYKTTGADVNSTANANGNTDNQPGATR